MKNCIKILKVIMVPLVAIYPLYMNIVGGLVFIFNSKKFLENELITEEIASLMQTFSIIMFVSSALFSAAMIFAICKFNKTAVILDVIAMLLCAGSTIYMNVITIEHEMELITARPLSDNILLNHLPTIIPFLAILIVGLVQNLTKDTALGPVWDDFKQNNDENKKIIREGKKAMGKKLTDEEAEESDDIDEEQDNSKSKGKKSKPKAKRPKKSGKKKK